MFNDVRHEQSVKLSLSQKDPDLSKQGKITDQEIHIEKF